MSQAELRGYQSLFQMVGVSQYSNGQICDYMPLEILRYTQPFAICDDTQMIVLFG